jgi:hypothetical protein
MAGVVTEPIDIQKYKCVPLDLLKNVSPTNQVQFNAGTDGTPLTDFKNDQDKAQKQAAPINASLSGATIETVIATLFGITGFLLILVFLVNGGLNMKKDGIKAFITLPEELRTTPVLISSSGIFAVLGFLFGYFIRS